MAYDGEHKEGYEVDSNGRGFDPDAGSTEPIDGRCNALLRNWKERYGEKRYCGRIVPTRAGDEELENRQFCSVHKDRKHLRMHASDVLESGLHTKTIHHLYDKIPPYERVFAYGLYDQLLDASVFSFETEYIEKDFDFSEVDDDLTPEAADEDGILTLEVPNPAANQDRAISLWLASIDRIKMLRSNALLKEKDMRTKTTEHAQLTKPTESDPTQTFETIEQWTEHYLNLPYSRLVRDIQELLEYGGVGVEDEEEAADVTVEYYYDDPLSTDPVEPESLEGEPEIPVKE